MTMMMIWWFQRSRRLMACFDCNYQMLCCISFSSLFCFCWLPPPKKEVMFSLWSVCLSVCLSVCRITETDFDEISLRGRASPQEQWVLFWWRSGSPSGSRSPKSEIRIHWILAFGGGLCCLSASRLIVLLCFVFLSTIFLVNKKLCDSPHQY